MNNKDKKEIVKEFYPFVSEALKQMDKIDIPVLKSLYDKILTNTGEYSVDEIFKAQETVMDIVNKTVEVFKNKLIKNISIEDILLYSQVSKSIGNKEKSVNNFFKKNDTGVSIDTKNMVGTKSFTAIQNDLFGGEPTVYKNKRNKSVNINDKVMLYSTIPYLKLEKNQHLYRIATLIPYNKQTPGINGYKSRGLIYGMLPTMYFVTDNKKRDYRIARNNYIKIVRSQNEKAVKKYEDTYGITLGYDVSAKLIK